MAVSDQAWFYKSKFYTMLDDYIESAPAGSNEAITKPRYHGSPNANSYLSKGTGSMFSASAGGYSVKDLFERKLSTSDPDYVAHNLDMGGASRYWSHHQYAYNPAVVHDEVTGTWERQPDRRVAYKSNKYPWLIAAYRFHNKVNMHYDWGPSITNYKSKWRNYFFWGGCWRSQPNHVLKSSTKTFNQHLMYASFCQTSST